PHYSCQKHHWGTSLSTPSGRGCTQRALEPALAKVDPVEELERACDRPREALVGGDQRAAVPDVEGREQDERGEDEDGRPGGDEHRSRSESDQRGDGLRDHGVALPTRRHRPTAVA